MREFSASRLTAFVAIIVAALMVGSPAAIFGNSSIDPVGTVSAADVDRIFEIGVVDMTIATLNPNTYTMVAEGMAIFPVYSTLMQWDAGGEHVIGDLAQEWSYSPDGLTYECTLVDDAWWVYWDVDSETLVKHSQVTSEDVQWSIDTLAADERSRLHGVWPNFDGVNIIESTWTDGPLHFGITIREPFVPFEESLMSTIIMPKYVWESVDLIDFENTPPVGSGAFYYKTDGLPDAGLVELARNPYWHGESLFGWQLHVDEFVMVRYDDSTTLYEGLKNGDVHAMMGVDYPVFVNDLPDYDYLEGYSQSNGFIYEFNLNQMTDALRDELGEENTLLKTGRNSQLLLNHTIKKAISMAVDRDELINEYLYGFGTYTTTLVPTQNPMSHTYATDGHDCLLDPGETVAQIDPIDRDTARDMLWDAGWRYDSSGTYYADKDSAAYKAVLPLCNATGDSLTFRFYTLNTANTWEGMCNDIVNWTAEIGMEFDLTLKSVNSMNGVWYAADYDAWLWDWVLYPYGETCTSVLSLFTTAAIGTDSDVYLSDPWYDELYNTAIREMDYDKRLEMCYDMQDFVYLNRGCNALAFREDLYAFNTNYWENFGDLETEYFMLPDVWPTWLCAQMNPKGNAAPQIGNVGIVNNTGGVAQVETAVTITAYNVLDDYQAAEDLEYKWIVGSAGSAGEPLVGIGLDEVSWTFTEDGVYPITLVVKETVPAGPYGTGSEYFDDYFSSYFTVYLTVYDYGNSPPHDLSFEWDIADPTAGEVVTFTGYALDDDDSADDLAYTWDFGDGSSAVRGQVVEHQFPDLGYYTVTLMVDDRRYGEPGTRPAEFSRLVTVSENSAPTATVPPYGEITVRETQTFTVLASDIDPRDELLFTWFWGDGGTSVTTVPSADHSYFSKGTYTITVWVDDQTGLSGHNISRTGTVTVVNSGNSIPAIVEFYVEPGETAFLGQTLEFTAMAGDGDGDALTFTFDWDDTTTTVVNFGATGPNDPVECVVEKTYAAAGLYSVYLTVTDGTATALSPELVVTIEENLAPVITAFNPESYWDTDLAMSFSVSAYDEDGDTLGYLWDFGDGTTDDVSGSTATHTFTESGTYTVTVTVDDGKGLEISADADVTVNSPPYIWPKLTVKSVDEDEANTYSVSAHDDDGDSLTCMWDFGDGTDVVFGQSVSHTYADIGTYTYSVWVWDDFEEYRPVTHNVTSSSTVSVGEAGVDDEPVIEPIDDIYAIEGEEVEIWAYASDDGGEEFLTYIWQFDDGSDDLVSDPPVTHVWTTAGEYTLTLWVHDESGLPENNVSTTAAVHIAGDEPPVADAGGDRTVSEDVSVDFTAEESYDDLGIVGYEWTVDDFGGAESFDTETFSYTFYVPGVYTVELVVEDTIGQFSEPDVIYVTVTDETPPTANAGPDQTVHNGTMVYFSGSGEDADDYDTELDFTWTFIYDGALRTLTGETPSYLFEKIGGYVVTLRVEDDAGNYAEDEMMLTIADLEDPVADAGEDQTVTAGDTVTFDGADSYDDDTPITFEWTFTYDGGDETLTGESPTFVFDIADTYVVTLTVTDGGDNTATDTVTITVEEGVPTNEAPVADAGLDQTVTVGDTVTFDGTGSSDDTLVVNYTWTFTYNSAEKELWGAEPTFVFAIAGTYEVTLTVMDAEDLSDTDTVIITVEEEEPPANEAPVADAGDDQTVTKDTTVTFDGSGSSDDVEVVTYVWTFTYDGEEKTLTGESPTFTFEIAGEYVVTLTVTDGDGETDTDTVTITVTDDDQKSFIEQYGLVLAAIAGIVVVAAVALMLMKRKKGGSASSSGVVEETSPAEPGPPTN